ncbi:MAG: hypothetical protein WCP38_02130 [Chloroflexota bacterium]
MRLPAPVQRASEAAEREAPPRIPVTDQRLIRITAVAALAGALLSALLLTSINPSLDPIAGLAASLVFGCTLALGTAPILLVESYRRHPGQWRGRRRRALRRSLILGAILGGYSAFRVVGLGSLTGLLIAVVMAAVIEAALTRADDDTV